MHLSTELFLAAPASGLPSLLTAAVSQHFLIADVFAAPASGLPSLLIASFLQDCASAGLTLIGENNAVAAMKPTSVAAVVTILFIGVSHLRWHRPAHRELTMRNGAGNPLWAPPRPWAKRSDRGRARSYPQLPV